jgi:hypothetical protein
VDAKDDVAKAFYLHFGFKALQDAPLTLYLPLGRWSHAMARAVQKTNGGRIVVNTCARYPVMRCRLDARNRDSGALAGMDNPLQVLAALAVAPQLPAQSRPGARGR